MSLSPPLKLYKIMDTALGKRRHKNAECKMQSKKGLHRRQESDLVGPL